VTIDTANTVFAAPGDVVSAGDKGGDKFDPKSVFDQGVMLPLAGQPYGLGALATPDASVAGQSANPLVGMDTAKLLQHDAAKRVLAETGLTDADTVEWLAGPEAADAQVPDRERPYSILGTETDPEHFVGVVSGEDGPWLAVLIVSRITDDDHVIAVGGTTRPVGSVEKASEMAGPLFGPGLPPLFRFVSETMGRLQAVPQEGG